MKTEIIEEKAEKDLKAENDQKIKDTELIKRQIELINARYNLKTDLIIEKFERFMTGTAIDVNYILEQIQYIGEVQHESEKNALEAVVEGKVIEPKEANKNSFIITVKGVKKEKVLVEDFLINNFISYKIKG